jgi:hypothetical protein
MWCIGMYTEWFAFKVSFSVQLKDDHSLVRRYCSFNYRCTYWYVTLQLTLHSRSLQSKIEFAYAYYKNE